MVQEFAQKNVEYLTTHKDAVLVANQDPNIAVSLKFSSYLKNARPCMRLPLVTLFIISVWFGLCRKEIYRSVQSEIVISCDLLCKWLREFSFFYGNRK